MKRPWVVAVALFACGCVPEPTTPVEIPVHDTPPPPPLPRRELTCVGTPLPAPEKPPSKHAGTGRAHVTASAGAAPIDERKLRVTSEGAPLGSLAMELGHALGVDTIVADGVGEDAVWLDLTNADLASLDRALVQAASIDLDLVRSDEGEHPNYKLFFETPAARAERSRVAGGESPPIETRVVDVPNEIAIGLAETYCRFDASPRGKASVVGDVIIVRDVAGNLNLLEALVDAVLSRKKRD